MFRLAGLAGVSLLTGCVSKFHNHVKSCQPPKWAPSILLAFLHNISRVCGQQQSDCVMSCPVTYILTGFLSRRPQTLARRWLSIEHQHLCFFGAVLPPTGFPRDPLRLHLPHQSTKVHLISPTNVLSPLLKHDIGPIWYYFFSYLLSTT